jgi:hypothetical protein
LRKTTPEVPVAFASRELIVINKPEGHCSELSGVLHKLYFCGDFGVPVAACETFEIREGILHAFLGARVLSDNVLLEAVIVTRCKSREHDPDALCLRVDVAYQVLTSLTVGESVGSREILEERQELRKLRGFAVKGGYFADARQRHDSLTFDENGGRGGYGGGYNWGGDGGRIGRRERCRNGRDGGHDGDRRDGGTGG